MRLDARDLRKGKRDSDIRPLRIREHGNQDDEGRRRGDRRLRADAQTEIRRRWEVCAGCGRAAEEREQTEEREKGTTVNLNNIVERE
jgi:hypothetical protein